MNGRPTVEACTASVIPTCFVSSAIRVPSNLTLVRSTGAVRSRAGPSSASVLEGGSLRTLGGHGRGGERGARLRLPLNGNQFEVGAGGLACDAKEEHDGDYGERGRRGGRETETKGGGEREKDGDEAELTPHAVISHQRDTSEENSVKGKFHPFFPFQRASERVRRA